uniref:Putative dihydrofolate reductase n=1 Tax=Davidia involucrata TaxID=16924 RepID=A0A5B6YWX4_DAVIN
MKLFVSISGTKFRDSSISEVAYKDPIKVKSVHFVGAKDWLRLPSEELATAFDNPLIIRHPQGHTVPRLDVEAVENLRHWTREIFLQSSSKSTFDDDKHGTMEHGEVKVELPKKLEETADNGHGGSMFSSVAT